MKYPHTLLGPEAVEQALQLVEVHRFREMCTEACLPGALLVFNLPESGECCQENGLPHDSWRSH